MTNYIQEIDNKILLLAQEFETLNARNTQRQNDFKGVDTKKLYTTIATKDYKKDNAFLEFKKVYNNAKTTFESGNYITPNITSDLLTKIDKVLQIACEKDIYKVWQDIESNNAKKEFVKIVATSTQTKLTRNKELSTSKNLILNATKMLSALQLIEQIKLEIATNCGKYSILAQKQDKTIKISYINNVKDNAKLQEFATIKEQERKTRLAQAKANKQRKNEIVKQAFQLAIAKANAINQTQANA